MKTKLLIIISVLLIGSSSCKIIDDPLSCTEQYVYGLSVTLKDAVTNSIIFDNITIKAMDGSYEETLINLEGSNYFIGAGERSGAYSLIITSPDYKTYTSDPVLVYSDDCHVIPEVIEFTLQPN